MNQTWRLARAAIDLAKPGGRRDSCLLASGHGRRVVTVTAVPIIGDAAAIVSVALIVGVLAVAAAAVGSQGKALCVIHVI